jgi:hypothetical protein
MSDPYSEDAWKESFGSSEERSTASDDQNEVLNSTGAMAYGGRRHRSRKHRASRKKKTHRRKSRGGRRHKKSHRRRRV